MLGMQNTMPISKDKAIEIANAFVQQRQPGLCRGLLSASLECRGSGVERLGMGSTYWSVMFDRATSEDVIVSSGEVIVLVDEESGRAAFYPVL
jgi:hypothetical protein